MIFRFGDFQLDSIEKTLLQSGHNVPVTPKVFDLLLFLVMRPRTLVTKEELLSGVWPGTTVEESNLSVHISALRRMLGDSATEPTYIETVARRGYRFIAAVSEGPIETSPKDDEVPPDSQPASLPSPTPTSTRTKGKVALLATAAMVGLSAIFWSSGTRREDGWNPTPLTTAPGLEASPALSPDASMVVYSVFSPRSEYGLWMQKLATRNPGTTKPIRLTNRYDYNATWSPDGKEIAYLRIQKDPSRVDEVHVVLRVRKPLENVDREIRVLDFNGPLPGPMLHFTPDGEWILTSEGNGVPVGVPPRHLVAISTRTGERRNILDPIPGTAGDSAPILSHDGKRMAFCRCPSTSACSLYVIPMHQLTPAGPPQRLTNSPSPEFRAVFLKDGSLLYPLGPPDSRTFWRTSFDLFGKPHSAAVSPMGEDVYQPTVAYTADGKVRLIYARNMIDPNIWELKLNRPDGDVVAAKMLIASTRSDQTPAFSPDGKRIAFSSTRSGQWEIWTCGADGNECLQLTHLGPAYSRYPVWSPNGKWIAFDSCPTSNPNLYMVPAGGGPVVQLTSGDSSNVDPYWSPDGKWLYFASNRSGRFEIYRSPGPDSPNSKITFEAVTTRGGSAPRVSPDGRTLIFRGMDGSYYRQTAPDSTIQKIQYPGIVAPPSIGPGTIAYSIVAENGQGFLGRLDWATNLAELLRPMNINRAAGVARSPDGRTILYGVNDRVESDLMVIDLEPFR